MSTIELAKVRRNLEGCIRRNIDMAAALSSIATLVVDPNAAASFTYSNLCEAVSIARNALESKPPEAEATAPLIARAFSPDGLSAPSESRAIAERAAGEACPRCGGNGCESAAPMDSAKLCSECGGSGKAGA